MINTVEKNYNIINNTFCGYKVTYTNSSLTSYVPLDEANSDYQAIQKWIEDGGVVIDNGANN